MILPRQISLATTSDRKQEPEYPVEHVAPRSRGRLSQDLLVCGLLDGIVELRQLLLLLIPILPVVIREIGVVFLPPLGRSIHAEAGTFDLLPSDLLLPLHASSMCRTHGRRVHYRATDLIYEDHSDVPVRVTETVHPASVTEEGGQIVRGERVAPMQVVADGAILVQGPSCALQIMLRHSLDDGCFDADHLKPVLGNATATARRLLRELPCLMEGPTTAKQPLEQPLGSAALPHVPGELLLGGVHLERPLAGLLVQSIGLFDASLPQSGGHMSVTIDLLDQLS